MSLINGSIRGRKQGIPSFFLGKGSGGLLSGRRRRPNRQGIPRRTFVMQSFLIICGAVLGGTGVFAGTFASHAIASICTSPIQLRNWDAAVRSWLVHSLVMLIAGVLSLAPQANAARGLLSTAGMLFLIGTVLFSGCLAVFAVSGRTIFAAIAPLGGFALLAGWMFLIGAGFWIE